MRPGRTLTIQVTPLRVSAFSKIWTPWESVIPRLGLLRGTRSFFTHSRMRPHFQWNASQMRHHKRRRRSFLFYLWSSGPDALCTGALRGPTVETELTPKQHRKRARPALSPVLQIPPVLLRRFAAPRLHCPLPARQFAPHNLHPTSHYHTATPQPYTVTSHYHTSSVRDWTILFHNTTQQYLTSTKSKHS